MKKVPLPNKKELVYMVFKRDDNGKPCGLSSTKICKTMGQAKFELNLNGNKTTDAVYPLTREMALNILYITNKEKRD